MTPPEKAHSIDSSTEKPPLELSKGTMMFSRRLTAGLVSVATVMGSLFIAAPSSGATFEQSVQQDVAADAATVNTASSGAVETKAIASPNYVAGKFYYNCVNSDGSIRTLEIGEKTTDCKGAAIQQYYESGQFVQTISLTTAGTIADPDLSNLGCAIGVVGTALAVLATDGITVLWIASTSATVGGTILSCATGT
ncbi:hypothetical protein DEI99_016950 [Curtobacterium sp. MCLR17_036]|uniref:hypothetical protein n=1 Tax=Curtobacterium sp. MCLR17_036 TaxID=2175620 RepID=UPI0011B82256|nr:hypothetical protein [Curtobacterium sp. MCLR17_036]WIE64899.1 hypothetical protein DEI99_016950 [Curtobacterium sp. MCLR17_036]